MTVIDGGQGHPASARTALRRGAHLARYEPADVRAVLDAGVVAHVGVVTPQGPIVVPMAYGRDDTSLYLHGSVANAALRAAVGQDVCVTVTVVDGLIFGRSPFHNSMRYRSVVVRGTARHLADPTEQVHALVLISDHVTPNWGDGRPPTDDELRRTMVVAVPLTEASAKVRTGGPVDEAADVAGPHWGGSVPIHTTFAEPVPAPDLAHGIAPPPGVAALAGRPVHDRP